MGGLTRSVGLRFAHALLFALLTIAFAMLPFGAWAAFTMAALVLVLSGGSAGGSRQFAN